MRAVIDIPEEQAKALAALCEIKKLSRAEAVRQAIAAYLAENRKDPKIGVFGLWAGRDIDGVKYQQDMRAEWDR